MSSNLSGTWNYPTHMIFGAGSIKGLFAACNDLGMKKPLLITDEGLKDSDIVSKALGNIDNAGLFTGVKGNPTGTNIKDGVSAYKEGGHDGIIAFGGGSGIDAAKAIALMAGQDKELWSFEDVGDNWKQVNEKAMAPVVAVPTTAGTGSEVGRASVITNEGTHEKKIIFHPKMLPEIVICDPELTIGLPAHLTAATGIDAFVHCFEAYCAPSYHPMAEGIALEGMRLIKEYLPRAYKDGNDIDARSHMLIASSMGATAFQKGLGGVHALAHPLGAIYDKHHGLLNAIILPYVMIYNRDAISKKMEHLARVLDLKAHNFDSVLSWVLELRDHLNIPKKLSEIDIPDQEIKKIGEMAFKDPSASGNPLSLSAEEYSQIFEAALCGHLDSHKIAA